MVRGATGRACRRLRSSNVPCTMREFGRRPSSLCPRQTRPFRVGCPLMRKRPLDGNGRPAGGSRPAGAAAAPPQASEGRHHTNSSPSRDRNSHRRDPTPDGNAGPSDSTASLARAAAQSTYGRRGSTLIAVEFLAWTPAPGGGKNVQNPTRSPSDQDGQRAEWLAPVNGVSC